jgi:hypothetical protein
MSDRVSQTILLCEDEAQARLTKAYMKRCGLRAEPPYLKSLVASQMQFGGNVLWVMNEFPSQLRACRQRQKKANTLLIVVVDADTFTVEDRRRQLLNRVKLAGYSESGANEPAVLLIPKRHIETWICTLLGMAVTEEEDCKTHKKTKKEDIRQAALKLFEWSRPNAAHDAKCVPSLAAALPQWRTIG